MINTYSVSFSELIKKSKLFLKKVLILPRHCTVVFMSAFKISFKSIDKIKKIISSYLNYKIYLIF